MSEAFASVTDVDRVTAGRRTWTDDQLTRAVSSQRSWRSVAKELGLRGNSSGVIRGLKRRADQLGLDWSHFIGNRTWSDADLRNAVEQASTWSDVLRAIDVSDTADARARIKGRAGRLGIDTSHLRKASGPARLCVGAPATGNLRDAAPTIAAAWFALRGCAVAVPLEPQEYDLLVTLPSGIQRLQVKSTTYRGANGKWQVGIGRHPYSFETGTGKVPYDPDSIDGFVIVNGDGLIYLVPIAAVAGQVGLILDSYERYLVGSAVSLLSDADPVIQPSIHVAAGRPSCCSEFTEVSNEPELIDAHAHV